ncbi:MAG: glycosyltransferase [Pseudomonadota bacterium]
MPRAASRWQLVGANLVSLLILGSLASILISPLLGEQIEGMGAAIMFIAYQVVGLGLAILITSLVWRRLAAMPSATPTPHAFDQQHTPDKAVSPHQSVTISVPVFNNADGIITTLQALMAQTMTPAQIIVVNDGSTDDTLSRLIERFNLKAGQNAGVTTPYISRDNPALTVLDAPHGGKAKALNHALALADTDLFVSVDADTVLAPDALEEMVRVYSEKRQAIAVAGVVTPSYGPWLHGQQDRLGQLPAHALTFYQTIEYALDFSARLGWETVDGAHVMSGCATAFRRDLLVEVGGFRDDTVTEDYEIIHRLRQHCADRGLAHQVLTAPRAKVFTAAPATLPRLLRQRVRWFQGFLQTLLLYRGLIGRARYGWFGALVLPVKTIDAVAPALVALSLGAFLMESQTGGASLAAMVIGASVVTRLAIDCVVGSISLALRQGRVAPYHSGWQSIAMGLALPVFYLVNRSLWLVIGLSAYGRLITGSRRW